MAYMNSVLWSALCGVPRCVPAVFASSRNATEGAPYRVKPAGKFAQPIPALRIKDELC
jgi:hypothetical protein